MITAALTWPQAVLGSVSVFTLGLVLSVAIWQVFRTGQTAIRSDSAQRGGRRELDKQAKPQSPGFTPESRWEA